MLYLSDFGNEVRILVSFLGFSLNFFSLNWWWNELSAWRHIWNQRADRICTAIDHFIFEFQLKTIRRWINNSFLRAFVTRQTFAWRFRLIIVAKYAQRYRYRFLKWLLSWSDYSDHLIIFFRQNAPFRTFTRLINSLNFIQDVCFCILKGFTFYYSFWFSNSCSFLRLFGFCILRFCVYYQLWGIVWSRYHWFLVSFCCHILSFLLKFICS